MLEWKRPKHFFEDCLKAIYGKRHLKKGSEAEEYSGWEEEVAGRLCRGQWGKTAKQLLEEDVFQSDVDSALCYFLFSSCYAFSKQWSQT